MAASSSRLPFLAALLLCCICFASSDFAHDRAECQDALVGLATCITYVQGRAKAPTPDCCDGLARVLAKNRKCLCVLIKDRDEPGLGLKFNVTLAMYLPTVCHAASNISECPLLLGLPPHSKEAQTFEQFGSGNQGSASSGHDGSPAASVTATSSPPSKNNADASGGVRMRWLGVEMVGGVWATPRLLVATLLFVGLSRGFNY